MPDPTAAAPPWQNRWCRILGIALLMYIISMIDRTNISMAIPAMRAELGLGRAGIGFATGTFFFGYVVLQIPAGRLSSVWSAKWVIFGLLLVWGAISASTALVRTENELIVNRFLLGVAEGGVLTSTLVLIRHWFTRTERARANTVFLLSLPLGSVIANPISGIVLSCRPGNGCSSSRQSLASYGPPSGPLPSPTGQSMPRGCRRPNASG